MQFAEGIFGTQVMLTEEVPLYVYAVKGARGSALIDSGVRSMFPSIVQSLADARITPADLKWILHTHSHHDHIGCNRQLKDWADCLIAAHARYEAWHRDFQVHYREFALAFPDIIPDSAQLQAEVFDPLDGEVPLDLTIDEGTQVCLGGDTVLEAVSFPGHMKAELAFFERGTRTLIVGDAVTGLDWSFFHSHLDVNGYRSSMRKFRSFVDQRDVRLVLFSHFGPKTPDEAVRLTYQAEKYIDAVETHVLRVFAEGGQVHLREVWLTVCDRMGRKPEFRALNMMHAHVEDLMERGLLVRVKPNTYALRGTA